MRAMMMLAGVAAMAAMSAPVDAKPGKGKGHKERGEYSQSYGYPAYGYQEARGCPPGLAKKGNGCLPPGQAKKALGLRSIYSSDYGYRRYSYNELPVYVRDRYFDDRPSYYDDYNYYYNDGYVYRVDPTTQVVEQIIRALIR